MTERLDPDFNPSEEVLQQAAMLLARASSRMQGFSYHESNNGTWQNWLLVTLSILVAAGVGGVILMYGDVREIRATQKTQNEATQAQLADIQHRLEIRMRGGLLGPDSASP